MSSARTTPARLPKSLPLLGHALHLLRTPWDFLAAARPVGGVVKIRIGPSPAYLVNDPVLIRRVLVTDSRKYVKGVQFDRLRPIIGNGLVTAAGEEHLKHRRLVQPAFHHSRIAGYAATMRQLAGQMTTSWRDGAQIAVDQELAELALKIAGKTLFSTELGGAAVDEVVRSMPILLDGLTKRSLAPTTLLEKLPTAGNRRFNEANRRVREVVDRIIAEYRQGGVDHGDMVSMLLLARDAETGEGLTDRQVSDEVITMLLAATETTSNAMSWALHVLGQRPDVEARLQAEVDAVLGDDELTLEHIGRLAYTRRVVTETLRLYSPAWLLSRRSTEPVTLGGHRLPAGASIMFSPYAVQRDPGLYAEADVFDPDRWLPERAKEIPRPAFIPFGAGSRQCIGEGFAWTEAIVVLATIARHWRLRPAVRPEEIRMLPGATLTPSQMPMLPQRRTTVLQESTRDTPDYPMAS
jgi:cytochrome P450